MVTEKIKVELAKQYTRKCLIALRQNNAMMSSGEQKLMIDTNIFIFFVSVIVSDLCDSKGVLRRILPQL